MSVVSSGCCASWTSSPPSSWPSEWSASPEQPHAVAAAVRQDLIEQVAQGAEPEHLAPAPPAVLLPVMEHVAPLAECCEVAGPVVAGVVIQVCAGQDHAGDGEMRGRGDAGEIGLAFLEHLMWSQPAHPLTAAIAPDASFDVPPCTVT